MKFIGQGRYQKVYIENGQVVKITDPIINASLMLERSIRYYNQIKNAGVLAPKLLRSEIRGEQIYTFWQYSGPPLIEALKVGDSKKAAFLLRKVLDLIKKTDKKKVAFYPLLEQFTVLDDEVYFVDFFPSRLIIDFKGYEYKKRKALTLKFYNLETKLLKILEEIELVKPNFLNTARSIIRNEFNM